MVIKELESMMLITKPAAANDKGLGRGRVATLAGKKTSIYPEAAANTQTRVDLFHVAS